MINSTVDESAEAEGGSGKKVAASKLTAPADTFDGDSIIYRITTTSKHRDRVTKRVRRCQARTEVRMSIREAWWRAESPKIAEPMGLAGASKN